MNYTISEYLCSMPLLTGGEWNTKLIEKVMESLHNGETHYVDVPGHPDLRTQIGEYLSSAGIASRGQVVVTAGIQEARFLSVQVLGKTRGKIVFPEVIHPGVRAAAEVGNLDYVFIEIGTDHRMLAPPAAIKNALSNERKVLYLESPSRLTGQYYEKEEMNEILSLCREHDVSVILDSGLQALVDNPGDSLASSVETDNTNIVIGEAWPGSGIDELYIGYIVASEEIVKKITVQKQAISICTSAPSQNGAMVAGREYRQKHPQIINTFKKRRFELESILIKLGANVISSPAVNFVMCEADPGLQEKLDAAEVRYLDSIYFGKPGYIQLPVTTEIKKLQ